MDPHAHDAAVRTGRGVLLDERYRLDQVRHEHGLAGGGRAVLWRAVDEPLDRRVAVLVVSGLAFAAGHHLLDAAARASRVDDARWVRVLDVGEVELDAGPAVWIASEWVEAPSLAAVVRDGPLRPEVATELVRQVAEALAVAERSECRHGRLHPDQVLITGTDLPRITGLEIAAAAHGSVAGPRQDVRSLGGLLYAALTAHWPLPGWSGLPAPPGEVGRSGRPRQLRAGIPRELDEVTRRALAGEFADVTAVARALAQLPRTALDAPAPTPGPSWTQRWGRWLWRLGPPAFVVVAIVVGWLLGSDLGRVPGSARAHVPSLPTPTSTANGAELTSVWRHPPAISSFDPEGDGQENEDAVTLAVDDDPSTAWSTQTYRGSARFGGLKDGVGLLIDLRRPVLVREAAVALSADGAAVQLRAGNAAPRTAADLPVVASAASAPASLRLHPSSPVTARYWLLWFTGLPPGGGGYRIGVAEIALLH